MEDIMQNNKLILKNCPNFYKIINFEYFEDDFISEKLVEVYENYIFNISLDDIEQIDRANRLDSILSKYVDDYLFRKEMKNELLKLTVKKTENVFMAIVNYILTFFERYEEDATRKIYISRWI